MSNCKVWRKTKIPNLWTKNDLLSIFNWKPLFGYFRARIEKKPIAIFKISTFKFVQLKHFSNLGLTIPCLEYFGGRLLKSYYHIWNQHPQIFLIAKFWKKTKIPKFLPKNTLLEYFWTLIFKNYCHIWNVQHQFFLI